MQKQQIITTVQDLTEHKADERVNYGDILELRIAKFVAEKRFWWRRRVLALSLDPTQPNPNLIDMSALKVPIDDLTAIRRMAYVDPSTGRLQRIDPVWDEFTVMEMQLSGDIGPPTNFTIEPGNTMMLRIYPIPDQLYALRMAYLSGYHPDPTVDNFADAVPPSLHYAVVDGLEMDITRFLYGPEDNKFAVTQGEYQASVEKCFDLSTDFTTQRADNFATAAQPAVTSTSRDCAYAIYDGRYP